MQGFIQTFNQTREFFKGRKTYIIGVLMIALGLLQGDNQMILEGIGFITFRVAIK